MLKRAQVRDECARSALFRVARDRGGEPLTSSGAVARVAATTVIVGIAALVPWAFDTVGSDNGQFQPFRNKHTGTAPVRGVRDAWGQE